jgi:DNA-directed RNA polymerase specialized sigma24 family protein
MTAGAPEEQSQEQRAFRRFLEWLDEGVDSSGQRYLEIHRRLAAYFDRKNCLSPDSLADEALNRVARRLDEEGEIRGMPPAQYCYVVARYVFLEDLRQARPRQLQLADLPEGSDRPGEDAAMRTLRQDCLERCLEKLDGNYRELILEYYRGECREKIDGRRQLAQRLGVTLNALSIRACRIRERLENCVRTCSANRSMKDLPDFRLIE